MFYLVSETFQVIFWFKSHTTRGRYHCFAHCTGKDSEVTRGEGMAHAYVCGLTMNPGSDPVLHALVTNDLRDSHILLGC